MPPVYAATILGAADVAVVFHSSYKNFVLIKTTLVLFSLKLEIFATSLHKPAALDLLARLESVASACKTQGF